MTPKLLDVVILSDGSKATIVDIIQDGRAFIVEQEKKNSAPCLFDVTPDKIKKIV